MYLQRFRKTNPFSLPFTFDIENTWVSLALREDHSTATEDHAELLKSAFERVKMLIIEGKPATGKTSLMRRLAYEWAKGEQKLAHYALVLYAEFREVREKEFETIADLVLQYNEIFMESEEYENLAPFLRNRKYCEQHEILLLLDGYDESSLGEQCKELFMYLRSTTIRKKLVFNIVVTTRPGYLGQHRGNEGRFIFADVLGFITMEQKDKYILNHFKSLTTDNKKNIEAVHQLLQRNENLNKLAETPLFLTFICLVHERIVDGTMLELYCNTIWWLIDRHQKDFVNRDVPLLFEFHDVSSNKFRTIQDNYLQFPQLLNVGKMAVNNLEKNLFHESDCAKFNLKEIIQQVGLLRKDEFYDQSFRLTTTFSFPHRTIQEFLAAFYGFRSHEQLNSMFTSQRNIDTMNEYEKFILRIALSNKIQINEDTREKYFNEIISLSLNLEFEALNRGDSLNSELLKSFISQCINVQNIQLNAYSHGGGYPIVPIKFHIDLSFHNLKYLHFLNIQCCIFTSHSQISFKNCPLLKDLQFGYCKIKSTVVHDIALLPAIETLKFLHCDIATEAWQTITTELSMSSVKYLKLLLEMESFQKEFLSYLQECNRIETLSIDGDFRTNIPIYDQLFLTNMKNLTSLTFTYCFFKTNSQLSILNCPSLINLKFYHCVIESGVTLHFPKSSAVNTLEFNKCNIDLNEWPSITDGIRESSVKSLKFTPNCLNLESMQKCDKIEEIYVVNQSGTSFEDYENDTVQQLINLAENMHSLKRIVFDFTEEKGILQESIRELVEKAARVRDHNFKVSTIPYKQ